MRASTVGGVLAWLLWVLCALVSAVGVYRQDALVAVQFEKLTGPLGIALVHLPVALLWDLLRRVLARWSPLVAGLLAPLLPLLLFALFWVPAVLEPASMPAARSGEVVDRQDIVLITLDTVRADRVGAIGGGPLTPEIDKLAAKGTTFTQAVTTSPVTAPAHASMFTGAEVPQHQLYSNGGRLGPDFPSFVEALRARGYRTGGFVSAHVMDRETRLHQGFHHYDDRWGFVQRMRWLPIAPYLDDGRLPPRRSGADTVDQALRWLYADDAPALLWVHLFDSHGPYAPPSQFQPSAQEMSEARRIDRETMRSTADLNRIGDNARSKVRQQTLLYESSVRWVDALVGRLVGRLRGDPIVIVVGDHGESLGEHDTYFGHGGTLWEEAVRVPMVVRWPGRFDAGDKNTELVSVRAVNRLAMQAAGLEDLAPVSPEPNVLIYTTGQEAVRGLGRAQKDNFKARQMAALRYAGGKLIARGGESVAWYDLMADPQEAMPLPVPEALAADAASLQAIVDAPPPRLSEHQRKRLEQLGYLE